jgi:hypothetical protein
MSFTNPQYYLINTGAAPYAGPTAPAGDVNDSVLPANCTSLSGNVVSWSVVPNDTTVNAPFKLLGQSDWTIVYSCNADAGVVTKEVVFSADGASANVTSLYIYVVEAPALTNGIVSDQTKDYLVYTVGYPGGTGSAEMMTQSKFSIHYTASNITALTPANASSSVDAEGYPIFDSQGRQVYSFDYEYERIIFNVNSYGVIGTSTASPLVSGEAKSSSVYEPFENYIMDTHPGNLLNIDLFYQNNNRHNLPVIKTVIDNVAHYLAFTWNSVTGLNELVNIPVLGATGSTGATGSNAYISIADGVATINLSPSGESVTVNLVSYQFADVTIDPITNAVTFNGPVIVQLVNMLMENEDALVESAVSQIDAMITAIGNNTFQVGTLADYTELISNVQDYTDSLAQAKLTLNLEQITALEQYASNVNSMSNLFGQLIIQMQSASLVDSQAICQRMLHALTTIQQGLVNIKTFKIAIGQQNVLTISKSLLEINTRLSALYAGLTTMTVGANTVSVAASAGPLFMLQESIYFFANGLPTPVPLAIDATGATAGTNTNWYPLWSASTVYVLESFYDQFKLSVGDKNDIDQANAMIISFNANLANSNNLINNSPDVVALRNSLGGFSTLATGIAAANARLMYKLGQAGFKINFKL